MKKVSPLLLLVLLLSSIAFAGSSATVQKWLDFKTNARSGGTSKGVAVDMGDGTFVVLNGSVPGVCAENCPAADGATPPQSMEALSTGIRLWGVGSWEACSNTCGAGASSRQVSCLTAAGQPASGCDDSKKPDGSSACMDVSGCSKVWASGEFGACLPACGTSTQFREVSCLRGDGTVLEDGQCSGAKPSSVQSCMEYSSCTYAWAQGGFSACSVACGTGAQTQTVACQRSDGTIVEDAYCAGVKPSTSQSCLNNSGCIYKWVGQSPETASILIMKSGGSCGNLQSKTFTCNASTVGQKVYTRPANVLYSNANPAMPYGYTGAFNADMTQVTLTGLASCSASVLTSGVTYVAMCVAQ
jgi:hypothetical protein